MAQNEQPNVVRRAADERTDAVEFKVETGKPLPDLRGGQTRKPSAIRDAVAGLVQKGVPTPDGEACALWFPEVTEKTLAVRRALSQLQRAGAEFNVTVVKHWRPASRTRGAGRNRTEVEGSEIVFFAVPRMAGAGKRAEDQRRTG